MRKTILFILFAISGMFLFAQESNSVAGGNATGSGGSVSYSIGQTFSNVVVGTNGSVIQGVQQPYEISVVTAIDNTNGITLECKVYPNPTSGLIRLHVKTDEFKKLRFQLYDLKGVLILDNKVVDEVTEISMESLPASAYFMNIYSNNLVIKSFKIIKN